MQNSDSKIQNKESYVSFKYHIWAADLTEMRSSSSKNSGVDYLLCMIDVFTAFALG